MRSVERDPDYFSYFIFQADQSLGMMRDTRMRASELAVLITAQTKGVETMRAKRYFFVVAVLAIITLVAAMSFFVGGRGGSTTAAGTDPDLNVPSTNMSSSANFKASPATGVNSTAPVSFANIKVNPDNSNHAQNEPFAAVDPSNSRHLVVGSNSWLVGSGHFDVFAYTSFDGGKTWAASQPYIDRNASRLNGADPTVAFGPNGKVYFGFVAFSPAQGAVAVSTSLDGGLTWSSQSWVTSFAGAADKPSIAASGNSLYVFYQNQALLWTSSSNGGATWSTAKTIEAGGHNAAPVVDRNGNVKVFYNTSNAIRLASVGLGPNSNPVTVANTVALQARPTQYRAGIYPAAAIDANGNYYVAWADGRNVGRGNDILYSHSSNGSTWSAPITVNTDTGSADQLMPSLSVSANGVVTVAWLDNRNDPANINYDVYLARSTNGSSFGANQRVTSVSSNPNNDPDTLGQLIGDYFATAQGGGVVYTVWTDTRNNNEDIYLAPVSIPSN
jgi:hypothetical protein